MANTPNMNLALPTVSVTLGPPWATQLNVALSQIDSHNHTTGSGVQVPTLGININGPLPFNGNDAITLRSVRLSDQTNPLTAPTDVGCLYLASGNLYFNSGTGAAVQITAGGAIAGTPGSIGGLGPPAAATYTSGNTTFRFTSNTNVNAALDIAQLTIRQPIAAANGITIQSPNSLAAAYSITLPTALPAGQRLLTLDNLGVMSTANTDGATTQIAAGVISAIGAVATAANASVPIKGNRTAADTGTDIIISSTVTRTAGLLLDVQNAGVSKLNIDPTGNVNIQGTGAGFIITNSTGPWTRLLPNSAAGAFNPIAQAGDTSLLFSSGVSGGGGLIIAPWNAAATGLRMDGAGNFTIYGSNLTFGTAAFNTISPQAAGASFVITGTRAAADANSDVYIDTGGITRTAGNLLVIQNAGASKFAVAFDGSLTIGGSAMVGAWSQPVASTNVSTANLRIRRLSSARIEMNGYLTFSGTVAAGGSLINSGMNAPFNVGAGANQIARFTGVKVSGATYTPVTVEVTVGGAMFTDSAGFANGDIFYLDGCSYLST